MERSIILLSSNMSEQEGKEGKNTQLCGFLYKKSVRGKIKAFYHRFPSEGRRSPPKCYCHQWQSSSQRTEVLTHSKVKESRNVLPKPFFGYFKTRCKKKNTRRNKSPVLQSHIKPISSPGTKGRKRAAAFLCSGHWPVPASIHMGSK